ncbi:MAG: hypothetical protein ACRCZP_20015 [Phycicoccus sp.]
MNTEKVWIAVVSDNDQVIPFTVGVFVDRDVAIERAMSPESCELAGIKLVGPWVAYGKNSWRCTNGWAGVGEYELDRTPSRASLESAIADARANLDDDAKFRSVLCSTMAALGLDDGDVAGNMAVSRSTVKRWMNGNAIPLPAMRKPVFAFLARCLHHVPKSTETE